MPGSVSSGATMRSEWNVVEPPVKYDVLLDTVDSDEPGATLALLTAMNLSRGSARSRTLLPFKGLFPLQKRTAADVIS